MYLQHINNSVHCSAETVCKLDTTNKQLFQGPDFQGKGQDQGLRLSLKTVKANDDQGLEKPRF